MTVGGLSPQVEFPESASIRSDNPNRRVDRCWSWSWLWYCASLIVSCVSPLGLFASEDGATASTSNSLDCEFRIVWGGTLPRPYDGTITIDRGTVKLVRNLNLQADAIGTVNSIDPKSLQVLPASPTQFGGVDVRIKSDVDCTLQLSFKDPLTAESMVRTLSLKQVLQGNWIESLDERGSRVAIERLVQDRLRVKLDRAHTVFETDETWRAQVSGYRTGLSAGEYELRTHFQGARGPVGDEQLRLVTVDKLGTFPAIDVELITPSDEGAYLVEFTLVRRRFINSFVSTAAALTRRLDVVAISSKRRADQIIDWQPLVELDALAASKPGGLAWLAPLHDLSDTLGMRNVWQQVNLQAYGSKPPVSHGRLESRTIATIESEKPVQVLTLGPNSWLALPISGLASNKPHRLRVKLPTDQPMELAVSVRAPDEMGNLPSLSRDTGIQIAPRECSTDGRFSTHDIIFWPQNGNNYLLLANTSETMMASVGTIDVEVAMLAASAVEIVPQASRRVGLYLDKPLMAESFSAPRVFDPITNRPLDSWQTWFTAAERLDQSMTWIEADTLLLKVFCEGGAIFPNEKLEPTGRFDSGLFYSDGRSEELKDYVELLLRRFDRDGRQLILAIDLDTPLPALASFEESQKSTLQRDLSGQTWPRRRNAARHRIRRYNPLDSRVQAELIAVVREIVSRYGHHPAFGGISLQLDQESQFIFAGDRWGLDAATLAKFAQAQGVVLPPTEQLETSWDGPVRLAFLNWRSQELTKLFVRMSEVINAKQSTAKLYLNAIRLWEKSPSEDDFLQPQLIVRNPAEYLLAFGIDAEALEVLPHVTLLQGRLERERESVSSSEWILELASERALQIPATSGTAALVIQQPTGFQLEAIEQLGNIAQSPSGDWVFPYSTSHDHYARKSLIQQIFDADHHLLASGGWLPAGGQNSSLQQLYRTFKELPPIKFDDFPASSTQTNLRVRTAQHGGRTFIQLVNKAPWTENVTLQVAGTRPRSQLAPRLLGSPIDTLNNLNFPPEIANTDAGIWDLQIDPYGLVALEVNDPQLVLQSVKHRGTHEVVPRIAAELAQIEKIVADAGDATQQHRLAELLGDFEYWTNASKPRGWNVSSLPDVHITATADLPHSGKQSLLIDNRSKGDTAAWIQSEPITTPRTGRLAVQAWLRVPPAGESCRVRLSVVGRMKNGDRFERYEDYGGQSESRAIANDWGRRPATLYVADVPTDELVELRVAIDVIGRGRVWVDDVEVFEALLHPDERIYLRGQVLVAKQNLESRNPFPAEQLLDSHWGHYLSTYRPADHATTQLAAKEPLQSKEVDLKNKSNWNSTKPVFQQWRESMRDRWKR